MEPRKVNVDGIEMDSRYPHEAGHALVGVISSTDQVEITDGHHVIEDGLQASAVCDLYWAQGVNESVCELALRRMAFAYGGVFGEASFACHEAELESCALTLYELEAGTKGDALKISQIREWAAQNGVSKEELATLNMRAWNTAKAAIQSNRAALIRIAKQFRSNDHLSDSEIRNCLEKEAT